jgi:hypothetical protein
MSFNDVKLSDDILVTTLMNIVLVPIFDGGRVGYESG